MTTEENIIKNKLGLIKLASTPAMMCGYAFFGSENLLFGSDIPCGVEGGEPGLR